jgi:hypothetical protein
MALLRFRSGGFVSLSSDESDEDDELRLPQRVEFY